MTARLVLPGNCFDDYCASLTNSQRHTVRRDSQRFAASGCTLHTTRLSESLSYSPQLLNNVQQRHGVGGRTAQYRQLLQAQAKWLDRYGVVVTSRGPEGEPISFSLSYIVDDTVHVRMSGMEYSRARETGSYFHTGYYAPIRLAYKHGISSVELGLGSFEAKLNRGALLEPLYGFFAGRGVGVLNRDDRQRVQRKVYQRLKEETKPIARLPAFDSINADLLGDEDLDEEAWLRQS
jgi:predicted N-acyltransferase